MERSKPSATVEHLRELAYTGRLSRRELLRRAAALGLAPPVVTALLAACGGSPSTATSAPGAAPTVAGSPAGKPAAKNQTMVYPEGSEVRSIDPANASETQSINVVRAAYEGLVAQSIGKSDIEPRLATGWQASENAQVYTFALHKGVKFHDGTTLDATAVKKSFDRAIKLNLATAAPLSVVDTIKVVDDTTVQFTLKQPHAYFVENLTQVGIISPTAFEKNDKGGDLGAAWLEENTAGTGPFRLTEMRRNEQHTMERFEGYWRGWGGNHLAKIVFPIVPEAATRRQMLERGEAHAVRGLPADDVKALEARPGITALVTKNYLFYSMPMNVTKPPLNDVRVRRAIQYTFDYQTFLNQVWLGRGTVPTGPTAPGWIGYNPELPPFKPDLEAAKKLLAEAGVTSATLEAHYIDSSAEERQSVVLMQDNLKKLGIDFKATAMPWATMFKLAGSPDTAPHMTNLIILPTRPDPAFVLEWTFGCNFVGKPYNWSYYCNPEVQRQIDQARSTADRQQSIRFLQQANKLVVDDAPVVWYGQPDRVDLFSNKVQNFSPIVIGYPGEVDWYAMYLSE